MWKFLQACGVRVNVSGICSSLAGEGPAALASRKQVVGDVALLRRDGEMKSYIDLLFLALVVVLCVAKIVTD